MSTLSATYRLRQKVLGYPVDIVDESLSLQIIDEAWRNQRSLHIVTLNAEMVIAAQHDQELDRIVRHAHLIVPDGSGVVWALRLAGNQADRLPGIELAHATLAQAAAQSRRVALLGGKKETMEKLLTVLPSTHPGINIVGSHHGYFGSEEDEEQIVDAIAQTQPELLLVALGVPKQEYFIDKYQSLFPKTVTIGVGGSFDVWVGNVRRAPLAFRRMHLEWLYRLLKEPWRARRMASALPPFALQVMQDLAKSKLSSKSQHGEKRSAQRQGKHDKSKERSKDNK
jgi:N-acetylglucosaminyldiphosphoundecaprenol N-acetyl-beta-D-mannosaminyltransferase